MVKCLDLFSGAGGAGEGYRRAGFDVTAVDIRPMPHNPHRFIQADALAFVRDHGREFDFIHASPPCQAHTSLKSMPNAKKHIDMIPQTRELLIATGKPWVIENVPGAPLRSPFTLCGTMFGLGVGDAELRRHRLFETNWYCLLDMVCRHCKPTVGVYGDSAGISHTRREAAERRRVIGVYGGHGRDRRRIANTQNYSTADRRTAMGIDWMTGAELSQAIPPAYTEWIGRRVMATLANSPLDTDPARG